MPINRTELKNNGLVLIYCMVAIKGIDTKSPKGPDTVYHIPVLSEPFHP